MKRIFLALLISLTGVIFTCTAQEAKYADVSKARFAELVNNSKGLIIDLRTPKEYGEGHIEGAVNIDYFSKSFEGEIDKLDKKQTVYIYCASGGRSGLTMKLLKKKGFMTVYHLPIGYDGWIEE